MPPGIFVTGIGIISSIGKNLDQTLQSVYSSASGIGKITHLTTVHKESIPVAEVKATEQELFNLAGIPSQEGYSRNTLLGIIAAREAFYHAGLDKQKGLRTGLISGTTVGGMDKCERYY